MIHTARIDVLARSMKGLTDEALLIEDPIDLFYLSKLSVSSGAILIANKEVFFFLDGRYFDIAKEQVHLHICHKEELRNVLETRKLSTIFFDSAKTTVDDLEKKRKDFPAVQWKGVPFITQKARYIKDKSEIEKMRKGANLSKEAFQYAVQGLFEGVSEKEVAWRYETFCREHGASSMAFEPIIAFGENSAFPHHRASSRKLKKNEIVLIDVGCVVDAYASDMTRTFFFGKKDEELEKMLKIVKEAKEKAISLCKQGVKLRDLDLAAREVMKRYGQEALFTHSLGHGIGLETHEYPRVTSKTEEGEDVLQEGAVITIEPGLYLKEKGGIRLEDTLVITQEGCENFYEEFS